MTMMDETVKKYTLTFLEKGYFISEEKRQPIVAEKPAPAKAAPISRASDCFKVPWDLPVQA